METLKSLVKSVDELPKIVKFILAIPFLDIFWVIYRIVKSVVKSNTLGIVLGIILLVVGIPFLWLVDMIFIVLGKNVLWFD